MRYLTRIAVLVGFLMGLAIAALASSGTAEARPASEFQLFTLLNGEPRRWQMPDAGWSGTYGSAVSCFPVSRTICPGGVLKFTPPAKIHVCLGQVGNSWDGGCVTTTTDPNYGDPAAADTPAFLVLQDGTNTVCSIPATGSATTPFFCLQ